MRPGEWHHTSKYFNCTDYYSEEDALEIINDLRAWKSPSKDVTVYENCNGSYLEWGGTRSHPKAYEIKFGPVKATKKGDWFILELVNGKIRKNKNTKGFHLFDSNKFPLTFNQ